MIDKIIEEMMNPPFRSEARFSSTSSVLTDASPLVHLRYTDDKEDFLRSTPASSMSLPSLSFMVSSTESVSSSLTPHRDVQRTRSCDIIEVRSLSKESCVSDGRTRTSRVGALTFSNRTSGLRRSSTSRSIERRLSNQSQSVSISSNVGVQSPVLVPSPTSSNSSSMSSSFCRTVSMCGEDTLESLKHIGHPTEIPCDV
jgi:hypothetical protein